MLAVSLMVGVMEGVLEDEAVMLPVREGVTVPLCVGEGVGVKRQEPKLDAAGSGLDAPVAPYVMVQVMPRPPKADALCPSTMSASAPGAGLTRRMCEARKASTLSELRIATGQGVGVGFTPHVIKPKAELQPLPKPSCWHAESSFSCTMSRIGVTIEPSSFPRTQLAVTKNCVSYPVAGWHDENSSVATSDGTTNWNYASDAPSMPR
jgi:hypothetical protein